MGLTFADAVPLSSSSTKCSFGRVTSGFHSHLRRKGSPPSPWLQAPSRSYCPSHRAGLTLSQERPPGLISYLTSRWRGLDCSPARVSRHRNSANSATPASAPQGPARLCAPPSCLHLPFLPAVLTAGGLVVCYSRKCED